MEGITLFVAIVIIAFGILQIILFFKIWGMTNDVKKIRQQRDNSEINNLINEAQIHSLKGDKEKATQLYKNAFYASLSHLYNEAREGNPTWASEYWGKNYPNLVKFYHKKISTDISLDFAKYDSYDKIKELLSK